MFEKRTFLYVNMIFRENISNTAHWIEHSHRNRTHSCISIHGESANWMILDYTSQFKLIEYFSISSTVSLSLIFFSVFWAPQNAMTISKTNSYRFYKLDSPYAFDSSFCWFCAILFVCVWVSVCGCVWHSYWFYFMRIYSGDINEIISNSRFILNQIFTNTSAEIFKAECVCQEIRISNQLYSIYERAVHICTFYKCSCDSSCIGVRIEQTRNRLLWHLWIVIWLSNRRKFRSRAQHSLHIHTQEHIYTHTQSNVGRKSRSTKKERWYSSDRYRNVLCYITNFLLLSFRFLSESILNR